MSKFINVFIIITPEGEVTACLSPFGDGGTTYANDWIEYLLAGGYGVLCSTYDPDDEELICVTVYYMNGEALEFIEHDMEQDGGTDFWGWNLIQIGNTTKVLCVSEADMKLFGRMYQDCWRFDFQNGEAVRGTHRVNIHPFRVELPEGL